MSKAITFENFVGLLEKVAQKIHAIGKLGFPKAEGILPMQAMDPVSVWSNGIPVYAQPSMASDYPLGLPTLDWVAEIEPVSPLAPEIPAVEESFMPLEFPISTSKESLPRRPLVAALPRKKTAELPSLNQTPIHQEPAKKILGEDGLKNLLASFEEIGMKVKQVSSLPSGATRITFDEFMASRKIRQSEFVRVGGQR